MERKTQLGESQQPVLDLYKRCHVRAKSRSSRQVLQESGVLAPGLKSPLATAGADWREELSWAIESLEEAEEDHARQIDEARRHVLRNLVLNERDVTRLGLYERQINAQFKSTDSLLERARAYRLGMPVPPPVSVDLTVSKGQDANGV